MMLTLNASNMCFYFINSKSLVGCIICVVSTIPFTLICQLTSLLLLVIDLSMNYGTGSGYKNRRPMERGIKIKTQADWEREGQEEKSSKEESEGQNITVNANDHGSVSSSGTNDSLYLFDNIS